MFYILAYKSRNLGRKNKVESEGIDLVLDDDEMFLSILLNVDPILSRIVCEGQIQTIYEAIRV